MRLVRGVLQAVGLATLLAFAVGAATLPHLGRWLQYRDTPAKADYILPLAGDRHRLIAAAELHARGLAPVILLSNDVERPPTRLDRLYTQLGYPDEHPYAFRRRLLIHLGVPEDAMQPFGDGHVSTVEEAEALARLLDGRRATILLVTSPYHARRARLVFDRAVPQATFMVVSPPEGQIADPWWGDQTSAQLVVSELARLIHYWLGGAFRSSGSALP